MMRGDGDVVTGWQNKLQAAIASITPSGMLAEALQTAGETRLGGGGIASGCLPRTRSVEIASSLRSSQ